MTSLGFTKNSLLDSPIPRQSLGSSPCAACTVRDLAVCCVLEGDELDRLNGIMTDVRLMKGDYLFDEGDDANLIFAITAGIVQLYKLLPDGRRQIMGFLFSGDLLGLTGSQEHAFSAEAITDVQACRFRRVDLENFIKDYPKMGTRLLNIARNELAEAQEQLLLLGRKTAIERVASFLLTLSERAAKRGEPDNPVSIPMSRNSLGDYLGLSTESVSRTLMRLKRQRLISVDNANRSISILDRDKLTDTAGSF